MLGSEDLVFVELNNFDLVLLLYALTSHVLNRVWHNLVLSFKKNSLLG